MADPGLPIRKKGGSTNTILCLSFLESPKKLTEIWPIGKGGLLGGHPPPSNKSVNSVRAGRTMWSQVWKAQDLSYTEEEKCRRKIGHKLVESLVFVRKIIDNSCLENVQSWILDFGEMFFEKKIAVAYYMISKISSVTAYVCVLLGYSHMRSTKKCFILGNPETNHYLKYLISRNFLFPIYRSCTNHCVPTLRILQLKV